MQDAQQIARELIQRHGAQAEAVAKERAEQLQAGGDTSGSETWRSALALVREVRGARRGQQGQASQH